MGLTVGFRSIVYNETENPDNLSLVFTNDIGNAVYPSEFFQETTNINYSLLHFGLNYEKLFFDKFLLNLHYTISYINGEQHRTRLTAEGNLVPSVVGYSTKSRSEIAFTNWTVALMFRLTDRMYSGFSYGYIGTLGYNNLNLGIKINL